MRGVDVTVDRTLTLAPAQAPHLAQRAEAVRMAERAFQQDLALLALGADLPAGAVLTDINVETGVLTFTAPEA